jgi:aconitase A
LWFFAVDDETIKYLELTARDPKTIKIPLKNIIKFKDFGWMDEK